MYTRGPWKVEKESQKRDNRVYYWVTTNRLDGKRETVIARLFGGSRYWKRGNEGDNARIIATAPEMLEMLEMLYELRGQLRYESVAWNDARDLIAKAKGEK